MLTSVLMVPITATQIPTAPTQTDPSHVLANQASKVLEHPVLVSKHSDNFLFIYILSSILFLNLNCILCIYRYRRMCRRYP